MKYLFIQLFVVTVLITLIGFYAYKQGIYDGMKQLCPDGEIGYNKLNNDYNCYKDGEIQNINLKTNTNNINFPILNGVE